ncbi:MULTISPECIES: TonB-dependent receptor [Myroides]|uniref:TonB-dependent siderophore receptor n=1 Tax=Myroides albus TaxID=2562892 RepID=A0A6I3LK11_9FLAO|nr:MULTISPECIES: TonB-dependent receptor [Myroides]MTG97560.1 TonB-dependent siderophore receptor [Myroides albus]MVX35084.1 TonB-dependent siderophore receptor [Myroides sp. LoEW2-1]UVD81163.1 TonB-dependent receptor [Myroides albus]
MRTIATIIFSACCSVVGLAQSSTIKGRVVDEVNKPLPFATIYIENTNITTQTDANGEYILKDVPQGKQSIKASFVGFSSSVREFNFSKKDEVANFLLVNDGQLANITVYGRSNKNVKKLQYLTRLPLGLQDQVQSISIVSDHIIKEQGALSITDAARNVAGVTQFASYGGVKESMSIRGFRGTPVLRNGVAMDSDFRTASAIADMQGVESLEVIKGSAAILQGIGNGLGAAGGVINLVTKTPNFQNKREIGFRTGSYGQVRPTLDIEQVLDKKETLSFRFNGAYERNDGWRTFVDNEHFYVNPSLSWKIDDKTKLTLEMDYLYGDYTPDRGTVNLGPDYTDKLLEMPHNRFLGYKQDNMNVQSLNYVARFERQLTEKLSFRFSSVNSIYKTDTEDSSIALHKKQEAITDFSEFANRKRTIGRSDRDDRNSVIQVDFIGKDIFTGMLKHTFQVGFDYRENRLETHGYEAYLNGVLYQDNINVLEDINNQKPEGLEYRPAKKGPYSKSVTPTYGFMAQDYIQIGDKLSALLGIRYSRLNGNVTEGATVERWNPAVGLIFKPQENISTFASYTTTSSLRQSNYKMHDGGFAGPQDTDQFEFGFKSNWFNDHLGVNFSYYFITQDNLLAEVIDENGKGTGLYDKVGSLKRNGFELEINGKITNNLEVMLGYANLVARYQDSPNYVDGSAPMNAPEHSANGWINYKFNDGKLNGLSLGLGVYYVGKRPVNEYARTSDGHGSYVNRRPFDMPEYTTVNAQIGYTYKNASIKVFANNMFDQIGYTSYYRGGYINEIAPRNFAAQLTYRF